jgi:hypothetical protein
MLNAIKFNAIAINARHYDPSRTLTIRNAFMADIERRFKRFHAALRLWLEKLNNPTTPMFANRAQGEKYISERERYLNADFMEWLLKTNRDIFDIYIGDQIGQGIEPEWGNIYIRSAYQKGVSKAINEMQSINIPNVNGDIGMAFNQPFHIDRLGAVYTRTFNEMKALTVESSNAMRAVLAQGMADGLQPLKIAKLLDAA